MEKIICMIAAIIMSLSLPMVISAEGPQLSLTSGMVYNIEDVRFTSDAALTKVTVNGEEVSFTQENEDVSLDASSAAALGKGTICATSSGGETTVNVIFEKFIDWSEGFPNYNNANEIDFNSWNGTASNNVNGISSFNCNATYFEFSRTEKTTGDYALRYRAKDGEKPTDTTSFIGTPYISFYLGVNSPERLAERDAVVDFYADVLAEQTNGKMLLSEVSKGFGNLFDVDGTFFDSEVEYAKDTWYTVRANFNTITDTIVITVKETNTPGAQEIEVYSANNFTGKFKGGRLTVYPTHVDAAFQIDNIYQTGYIVMPGVEMFSYDENGVETSVGSGSVPISANKLILGMGGAKYGNLSGNVSIVDSAGKKVAAAAAYTTYTVKDSNNTDVDRTNALISLTPESPLDEGNYIIVLNKDITVDGFVQEVDREIPFTVVATKFGLISPPNGSTFINTDAVNLTVAAPNAQNVRFWIDGEELAAPAKSGNIYKSVLQTEGLALGAHTFEAEALYADGAESYAKSEFTLKKTILTQLDGAAFDLSAANEGKQVGDTLDLTSSTFRNMMLGDIKDYHTGKVAQGPDGEGDTALSLSYNDAGRTENTAVYFQFINSMGRRYTDRVVISLDVKKDAIDDGGLKFEIFGNNVQYYGNSHDDNQDIVPGNNVVLNRFITPDGGLSKSSATTAETAPLIEKWGKGEWFNLKAVVDANKGTFELFCDDVLVYSETDVDFKCAGHIVRVRTTAAAGKTPEIKFDNFFMYSETTFPEVLEQSYSVDAGEFDVENHLITKDADTVSLVFDRMISYESIGSFELLADGKKVDAEFAIEKTAEDLAKGAYDRSGTAATTSYVDATYGSGSRLVVRLPEGIRANSELTLVMKKGAKIVSSVECYSPTRNVYTGTVYSQKAAVPEDDAHFSFVVGNSDGLYVKKAAIEYKNGKAYATVNYVNQSESSQLVTFYVAAFEGDRLLSIAVQPEYLTEGAVSRIKGYNSDAAGATSIKAMVWCGDELTPVTNMAELLIQ